MRGPFLHSALSVLPSLLQVFSDQYDHHVGALSPSPFETDRWSRLRDSVSTRLSDGGAVLAASAFWNKARDAEAYTDEERFIHLYVILHALDAHMGGLTLQAIPHGHLNGRERIHLVGQRWWDTHPGVVRRRLSFHEHFPHLGRGLVYADEWVDCAQIGKAFAALVHGERLTVALCTLSGQSLTQFDGTRPLDSAAGVFGFAATGVEDAPTETSASELLGTVQWAREIGAHVLVLPELSVDAAGRQCLQSEIEHDPGSLRLIIPGSFHSPTDKGRTVNDAPVWLVDRSGGTARVVQVAAARKREPFDMDARAPDQAPAFARRAHQAATDSPSATFGALREDIDATGHLPIVATPIGVFCVLICKDSLVLPTDFGTSPLRGFRIADHLALVSMNESPAAWFWDEADRSARQYGSATYYANTPQLVHSGDSATELAFWLLPRLGTVVAADPTQSGKRDKRTEHKVTLFRTLPPSIPKRQVALWPETGRAHVSVSIPCGELFGDDV